jgi:hypothetical protein
MLNSVVVAQQQMGTSIKSKREAHRGDAHTMPYTWHGDASASVTSYVQLVVMGVIFELSRWRFAGYHEFGPSL